MASYRLLIKPSAAKELGVLPLKDRRRVVAKTRELAAVPRPMGAEKLSGHDLYRVRQGDHRIVYQIADHERTITVFRIGHRRDVYR